MQPFFTKIITYFLKRKLKVVSLLLIFSLLTWCYFYAEHESQHASQTLSMMVNSVIGIPYTQMPHFKNDNPDIVRFSREQWLSLPYKHVATEIDIIEDKLNLVANMPSKEEVEHMSSLEIGYIPSVIKITHPIYKKLCPHFLTCEVLTILVQDYVLHKPEILRNIIKIAESPCDYIRKSENLKPGGEVVFSHDYGWMGHKFYTEKYSKEDAQKWVKHTKKMLTCNKNNILDYLPSLSAPYFFSKKYVLIMINKSGIAVAKNDPTINIIVMRKDI